MSAYDKTKHVGQVVAANPPTEGATVTVRGEGDRVEVTVRGRARGLALVSLTLDETLSLEMLLSDARRDTP